MAEQIPIAWYAIWTRSRHENVVREQLERKGYEAFLPTITKWSRWKDRKKKIDWPLFPGYCFARFDSKERLPILSCTGVVNIVSFDGEIAPIVAQQLGLEFTDLADLAAKPEIIAMAQAAVDKANAHLSRPEQVKAFELLPTEWTAESEELTPTLKLKRRVVNQKYSDVLDRLYG